MIKAQSAAAGHAAAIFTIVVWGTTFISTKVLLGDFSPFEILIFRFTLGYLALLAVHPRFVKTSRLWEELLFAGAGLCGVTLYFLLENIALTMTLASNVGIIVSVAPFFTAVAAHFFLKGERLRPPFFIGFAVAMLGIVLLTLNGSYTLELNPAGDILAVLACVCWAFYSVLMRKISGLGHSNIACTRRVFFYGLVFMLPALGFMDVHLAPERFADPVNLLNLLFLSLFASALCFASWNWCVGVLGAVNTCIYIYLVPVVTIAASWLILHERLTGTAMVGALLTLAGLVISERKPKPGRAAPYKEAGAGLER